MPGWCYDALQQAPRLQVRMKHMSVSLGSDMYLTLLLWLSSSVRPSHEVQAWRGGQQGNGMGQQRLQLAQILEPY